MNMNKRIGGRKAWHINTLLRRALQASSDSHSYWNCVSELHFRGDDIVFEEANKYCQSRKIKEKILGIDVLAQLGSSSRPYNEKTLNILLSLLKHETNHQVLQSSLIAVGHQNNSNRTKDVKLISSFSNHSCEEIRLAVISALATRVDKTSIATLIGLTKDKSSTVRDWATFSIGSQIEADTPEIRNALSVRRYDSDSDTRCEAFKGLTARGYIG